MLMTTISMQLCILNNYSITKSLSILTKVSLFKIGLSRALSCPFCDQPETGDRLFVNYPIAFAIWDWIAAFSGFRFNCSSIENLSIIDAQVPLNDKFLVELIIGAVLWTIWFEINSVCFRGAFGKTPEVIR